MTLDKGRSSSPALLDGAVVTLRPEWSLRALVREMLAEPGHAIDPRDFADEVLARIPTSQRIAVLRETLPAYIRESYRSDPNRGSHSAPEEDEVVPSDGINGTKQQARRRRRDVLLGRYQGADGWKLLRDFTADDCRAAADMRRSLAAANAVQAAKFDELTDLLTSRTAATVGDLPVGDVERVMSRA